MSNYNINLYNNSSIIYKIFIIFVLVVLIYLLYNSKKREGMINTHRLLNVNECPNVILKQNDEFKLYNLKKPIVPGRNPVKFNSLNEYVDFIIMLRKKNIKCPILFYQEDNNKNVIIPSLSNYMPYLPQKLELSDANHSNSKYNKHMYNSFDPYNQYNGSITILDKINKKFSKDNPMSSKWKGRKHTLKSIKSNDYKEDEIYKR